jgi:hypothetical protein
MKPLGRNTIFLHLLILGFVCLALLNMPVIIKPPLAADSPAGGPGAAAENTAARFPNLITADTPYFADASRLPGENYTLFDLPLKRVRGGGTYLLEMDLFRDRNIVGTYPLVRLFGREQRLNDFWREDEWQTLSLIFRAPRRLAARRPRISLVVPKGDYRLFVGRVELRRLALLPIRPRKGMISTGGELVFSWDMPATDRLLDLKILLSRHRGLPAEETLTLETDNRFQHLQPEHLPAPGRWFWKIEAWSYRTKLAESPMRSFRVIENRDQKAGTRGEVSGSPAESATPPKEEPSRPAVSEDLPPFPPGDIPPPPLDLDFFPIGIYGAARADFAELAAAGFNAVQLSAPDWASLEPLLRRAGEEGLRALLAFHSPVAQKEIRENALYSPICKGVVHAWYLDDEPEGRSVSPKSVRRSRDLLRRMGFREPGAIALLRSWRIRDYAPAADVFMSDPYPVPFNPLSWQGTALDEIRDTIGGDPEKQAWAVIQAFGWQYSSAQARATGLARVPTPEEVRALTYVALCHGAEGLYYYTYGGGRYRIEDHPDLWQGLKSTVREVRNLLPLLRAGKTEADIRLTCRDQDRDAWDIPAVHYTVKEIPDLAAAKKTAAKVSSLTDREVQGALQPGQKQEPALAPGLYLIAVNTLNRPVSAELRWGRAAGRGKPRLTDIFSGAAIPLAKEPAIIDFAPFERRILHLH